MNRFSYACLTMGVAALFGCNPVLDDEVAALGGEANGVRPGPQHRPGQPCLLCHDGALGDPNEFSVAGTVFLQPTGTDPVKGALVELHGGDGRVFTLTTNAAGNFFVSPQKYTPQYPLEVDVQFAGETTTMHSTIGRDGACASCHSDPAGPDSPGHVYVRLGDGNVPP